MDWGVVADANQEVWRGDGLKVARGGLLAYGCGCFCFVLFWLGQMFQFLSVGTCMCLYMQDQHYKEWYDFHILLLFFSIRSNEKVSQDHLSLPFSPLAPAAYLRVPKEAQGTPHLYPQLVKPLFACHAPYLGPTETVGLSQRG